MSSRSQPIRVNGSMGSRSRRAVILQNPTEELKQRELQNHEFLDRIYNIQQIIKHQLMDHVLCLQNPDAKRLVDAIDENMAFLYQFAGNLS